MSIFRYDKRKFVIKVFNRKQKHETKYETIGYYLILPTHQEISSIDIVRTVEFFVGTFSEVLLFQYPPLDDLNDIF
jgi:hypothetical protein